MNMKKILRCALAAAVMAALFPGCAVKLDNAEKTLIKKSGIGITTAFIIKNSIGAACAPYHALVGKAKDGSDKATSGIALYCESREADEIMEKYRQPLKARGIMLFLSQENFDTRPDEIALLKTRDEFDTLRAMGTCTPNYDLDTDDIINILKSWQKMCSFEITGAGTNWVSADFIKQPADMKDFASKVYDICPDVVDQGTGSVDNMAEEMKDQNFVYLWWQ
jgi:hypothetical protein